MFELIKKKLIFFLPLLFLIFFSCNSQENMGFNPNVKISGKVDFKKGFSIQLKINKLEDKVFNTKVFSNPVAAKSFSDIKSYSAFLSTSYDDPFSTGTNPSGDGIKTDVDNSSNSQITITFSNIHRGGPYFAIIAAFDDIIGGVNRNNITRIDSSILSVDKSWSRSNNSVTVLPDGSLLFSDGSNELKSDLTLKEGTPNKMGIQITVFDGNPIPAPASVK
jgi:hypothetical protein